MIIKKKTKLVEIEAYFIVPVDSTYVCDHCGLNVGDKPLVFQKDRLQFVYCSSSCQQTHLDQLYRQGTLR